MENRKNSNDVPMKYPRSVVFIVGNEFCERFSYYGMKTILALYFTTVLMYNNDTSTELYHFFNMLCYFFPIVGAVIADSYLGKYSTILYLSVVYALGNVLLSAASATVLGLPQRAVSLLGLLLIAVGTGGIKPCVCPFGGDQFVLPQQERQLQRYFSVFYLSINAGALMSTALTPIFREDVKCLGENSCFPLAFGFPAFLMIIALVIFVVGTSLYIKKKPEGNIMVTVFMCITHALGNKVGKKHTEGKVEHWLEYAGDKYDKQTISDIREMLNVLYMFIPVPFFWALFDQQGSRWIFQATCMDGRFFGYNIKPDQMQVLNPLLILVFIPLFEVCFYPLLHKIGIRRALQKLTLGGILAAAAFVISAILEFQVEATFPVLPVSGEGQIRFFNSLNCSITMNPPILTTSKLSPMSAEHILHFPVNGTEEFYVDILADEPCDLLLKTSTLRIKVVEGRSLSYAISSDFYDQIILREFNANDDLHKDTNGMTKLRLFYASAEEGEKSFVLKRDGIVEKRLSLPENEFSDLMLLPVGRYDIHAINSTSVTIDLNPGSIETLVVRLEGSYLFGYASAMVPSNTVHMLWQIPQIVIITAAEILFSVTGLEFSFTQAPESMKSVLSAAWLLTVAFGNLIVVVISGIHFFKSQAYEFLLFAGLMLLDIGIFVLMAMNYKYVDTDKKSNVTVISTPKIGADRL